MSLAAAEAVQNVLSFCGVQDEIVREAQTMRQQLHPNVLPLYTSFVHEQNLWMVMPYVSSGSVLNIMKYAHPEVRLRTTPPTDGISSSVHAR